MADENTNKNSSDNNSGVNPTTPAVDPARPKAFQEKIEREREAAQKIIRSAPTAPKEESKPKPSKPKFTLPPKIKKILFNILLLVVVLAVALGGYFMWRRSQNRITENNASNTGQTLIITRKLSIGGKTIVVELANSPSKRMLGLSGREKLDADSGMLFTFGIEGNYEFWMKDMKFPLDIVWINSNMEIVDITKNALPCTPEKCDTFTALKPFKYVLEVNSGWTDSNNVNIGNLTSFVTE